MRILGRLSSVNVQKVVWCAGETGRAFERQDVGGAFGGNTTVDYLAKNPNGRIPVLEDGDVVLWESNAIVRYLAARYGDGHLWPADPVERAFVDRWMDWASLTLNAAMHTAFWQLVRTPPERRDAAAIEASIQATEAAIAILDGALAGRAYIGGGSFTMGDIPLGANVHRWLNMPISRRPAPQVEAWYARLMTRPAAQAALPLPIT
jgi:glutathione S-transferase